MEEARVKLNRRGVLVAISPGLRLTIEGLIFWLIFRRQLPPRILAYLTVAGTGALFSGLFMAICLPELANRRGGLDADTRRAEKLAHGIRLGLGILVPTMAGVELFAFQTAAFDDVGFWLGLILYVLAFFLSNWARLHDQQTPASLTAASPTAEALTVAGPYRRIRHPEHLAMALSSLTPALLIGSLAALLPTLALVVLLAFRTAREDSSLRQGSTAYAAYSEQVRHRLLPGIW